MSGSTSCVVFIKLASVLASPVPERVESLVKSRLAAQYAAARPGHAIAFDQGACFEKGAYELTGDAIVLRAETLQWPGERAYPYSSLLDGATLEYPHPLVEATAALAPALVPPPDGPRPSRWVLPAVVGVGIAAAVTVLVRGFAKDSPAARAPAPTRAVRFGARQ